MGSIDISIDETNSQSNWQAKVAQKQQQCRDAIPEAWRLPPSIMKSLAFPLDKNVNKLLELDIPRKSGILSERELAITESHSVSELLAEVTLAFSKRAAIAQQLVSFRPKLVA